MPQSTTSSADEPKHRIAIFASGGGSNALKIIEYFADRSDVDVSLVITNKPDAGVLKHAHTHHIPSYVVTRRLLKDADRINALLELHEIDFIALAGFLLLMPAAIVERFAGRIVNIHPALLPAYGGKGMYGMNVHRAVKEAGDTVSGMTIHFVNTKYDEGAIIFQDRVALEADDTAESIAAKVLKLEHKHFARVIDNLL